MKRHRVVLSPFAAENIRQAHEWLTVKNPAYAEKWLAGIREKILSLETLPESHALAPENEAFDCDIRQALYGRGVPWRTIFTVDGTTVQVLHVRHGNRDYWLP